MIKLHVYEITFRVFVQHPSTINRILDFLNLINFTQNVKADFIRTETESDD